MGGIFKAKKNKTMELLTAEQIRQKLCRYAERNCLKMASISRNKHPCPIDGIGGRTLYDIWRGKKVGNKSLAVLELFFTKLETNV